MRWMLSLPMLLALAACERRLIPVCRPCHPRRLSTALTLRMRQSRNWTGCR